MNQMKYLQSQCNKLKGFKNSSVLLLAQGTNRFMETFSRRSSQERPFHYHSILCNQQQRLKVKMNSVACYRWSVKKVFLEISQNSQENTCARVCFPANFGKFLRTPFFKEHPWWLLLMLVQQNYSCDGTGTHSSFHVNSVCSSNGSKKQKKKILNQIILKPTIIFNKYLVYIKKFSCNLLLLKETYFC